MTNVNQNVERTFFVTHVYANGPYLNICGQLDRDGSRQIETLIRMMKDSFDNDIGAVTPQTVLIPNTICCAFHEDNYYRAKIIKVQPDGNVFVQFIDYGNFEVVHPSHIRLLDCLSAGLKLQTIPPIAFEFPLTKVMPFNNVWSRCIIDHIRHILRYNEHQVIVTNFGNRQILTLFYNGQDFSDFLIRNQMGLPAPSEHLQSFRIPSGVPILKQQMLTMPYRPPSHDVPIEPQSNHNYISKHRPVKLVAPPKIEHSENWRKPQEITQVPRPQPSISPRSQDIPAFKSRTLEKGSTHKVTVSDVDDGPLKFSVQLESCAQELETLMKSINSLPLKPLSEPPIPSSACLGRCSKDKTLRRAVVSTVNDTLQAKVFYVDFGNQETLAHTDIYEIPAQYANPPLLSVRFILSGVRDLTVTAEMKEYFKDLVLGKSLTLKVMPVEDSPLMHYGNLYYNEKSVLDMLRDAFPDSAIKFPDPVRLSPGNRENVHISYIEACNKFFVQLDKNVIELETLNNLLTECVKIAPPIKPAHIKPGLKCLAHCGADSLWYRAEVIQVVENQVTVHYVDYGNDETIPSNAIRSIRNDNVTKIPILAIQCILNGFESQPFNTEIHNKFESSVLDKPLVMSVLEERPSAIIVDLYDINVKPIKTISSILNNPDDSNVQQSQPITHWQEQESDASSKTFRGKRSSVKTQPLRNHLHKAKVTNTKNIREDSDRWTAKKQNESSEATYENSSFEEIKMKNWKNSENEEKRFNNREQKSKSFGDWNNSQSDRFNRENSRNDRFNRDSGSRYDRNDRNDSNNRLDNENSPNNRYRDKSNGRRGFSSDNNRRSDRNSGGENTWSDKDSNASSRSSGRRGRRGSGRGASRGDRGRERGGGRRDSARSSGRDSEGENDRNFKQNRSNDRDFNRSGGSRFRGDNRNDNNRRNDRNNRYQNDRNNSWDTPAAITTDFSSTSLEIPAPNITIGTTKQCEVVFSTNPVDFYVQLIPENKELDSVMEKIAETYETGGTNLSELSAKVGMNCIAQYSEDLKWYRAVIHQICDTTGVMVRFVDYGNTEVVSFDKIKGIESEFINLPAQAIHVKLLAASKDNWDNSEIERFTALTEMKTLEAEFVTLANDIYEVLLREIVDNNPQNSYINDEFSEGADLIRAKETVKNKNKSSLPKSSASTDYASLDHKWTEPNINLNGTEDVMITWITNPNDFYCQFLNSQKSFRSMMNEIQSVYTNKPSTTDNLQVGYSVIATYVDDGAFYRAEVIDIKPGGSIVRFIDYGNCAMVQPHEVFCVEKKFMDLPKQAISCSLKNITPPDGNCWSKANVQEIDNIFNVDKLQCNFVEVKNNKYIVTLKNYQQYDTDLAKILVERGLASYEECSYDQSQSFQGNNVPEIDGGDHAGLKGDLTKVDISYLEGQILRVKVSSVESVQKFHVQLPSVLESEKMISDFMAIQDSQVMPKLLPEEVCLGTGCLIHSERGWKRATVIDCSRKTDFDVRFIDTGEIRVVSLNYMLALPRQLTGIQKQAVECCLKNIISSITIDEQLKDMVENKEVIIRVDSLKKNILVVDLFDESGNKIILSDDQEIEKICPLCPMPIFYGVHRVSVIHINHSKSIWLKRLADLDTDANLLSELFEYYSLQGQTLDIQEQKLCAALSLDGNWYRAKVIKKTDTGALIQYIDYGNTEDVYFNSLKELESQFFKPFQLGIEVSLGFMIRGTEAEQQELLNTHLLNKEFYATIHKKNGKWISTLGLNLGSNIEEDFSLKELIVHDNSEETVKLNEPDDLKIGHEYRVILSHADNPTQFWIQRVKDLDAINELSIKLQDEIASYSPINGVPEEKLLCAVFVSDKRLWCRAEIIDADEEMATVRFVDYGNTDVVIGTDDGNKIKHLPDSMKSIAWYATKCRLNVVPVDFEDWLGEACSAFSSKVTASSDLKAVFIADSNPKRVELYTDNECISDWLVNKGYASKIGANESIIDELVDLELDPKSAFVSHIDSPNEFWVQEEKSVADLELIADRFIVGEMFPKVDEIKIGNLYVAKYPEDSSWYRAKVISHENEGTNVLYVDYGNSAISTEIRQIPEDIMKIPPLSRKCRLILPEGIKEWSEEACQEFVKMANDGATIFILDILEEGETSVVTLSLDGDDIVNHLKTFCEKSEVVKSTPLADSKIVMISHINSPNEFWIHEKDSWNDLNNMADKLLHAKNFPEVEEIKEGLLCVAEFPEDSSWYRAQVLSHGDTGTNVIYIDYGNSAVSTEIRQIPNDLIAIPALARKCSLLLPEGVNQWSDEACQEFFRHSNDGNTEYLMTILHETEMSVVKLLSQIINKDISDYLTEFSVKPVPAQVIEERLSPLGEENSPNVLVSHVVSPAEFWIQAENKITDLEDMANHLIHAESFLSLSSFEEGTICAAKFPEDGAWYRAKILSHGNAGTEVLYIDYGNSAISSEFKALPKDIIKIAPMSKLCCLKMPNNIEAWSEEACEKFIELVADGATMFKFEEHEELGNDPTFISLVYNGQNVVDILELLCQKTVSNETDVTQAGTDRKSTEYYNEPSTLAQTADAIPQITKTEVLNHLCEEFYPNIKVNQTDAEKFQPKEKSTEYHNEQSTLQAFVNPQITKEENLNSFSEKFYANETNMTQFNAEESHLGEKSTEYHYNEQSTFTRTVDVIPQITKTEVLDTHTVADENKSNISKSEIEESRIDEKIAELNEFISKTKKTEINSSDNVICEKNLEEFEESTSTSGVDILSSSDHSDYSHALDKLKPSPEIINSTLIPASELAVVTDNVTLSDKNADVNDTITILDSTLENSTIELSQTIDNDSSKILDEKHKPVSISSTPVTKEVRVPEERLNLCSKKFSDTTAFEEISFKIVRRNSLPFQDNAVSESITKGVIADRNADGSSAKCDLKKLENINVYKKVKDDENSKNKPEEILSCPTTPKTPHSEKFVAGVVTDHRIIEADDDEVIEVEVIAKNP